MAVTLTSEVMGLAVGASYTGPEEPWLLANGYARRNGYTGPGVANAGPADTTPANEVTAAENREAVTEDWDEARGPLDPALIDPDESGHVANYQGSMDPAYDFEVGGVNTDPPVITSVTPATGLAAGGTKVAIKGTGLKRTSAVTFGGTAGTALEVTNDTRLVVTTPAHAAGAVAVGDTNPNGSDTEANGFTYA